MLACIKANLHLHGISMRMPQTFDIFRHVASDYNGRKKRRKLKKEQESGDGKKRQQRFILL